MSRLGIIAALPEEAKCLYSKNMEIAAPVEIAKDIFLCLSGIGHEAAAKSTQQLLNLNMDALLSWGVAGALDSSLKPGDLFLADSVIGEEYKYVCSADWLKRLHTHCKKAPSNLKRASLASMTTLCTSIKDKHVLSDKTGALAVDMESAAIAELAKNNKLDFIVLRTIADDANMSIPEAVIKHTDHLGRPEIFGFLLSCISAPGQIKSLIQLGSAYKKGIKTLKHIATDLKKQHFLYNKQSFH